LKNSFRGLSITGMTNICRFAGHIQNFQTFREPYSDQYLKNHTQDHLKKKRNGAGGQNKVTKDNLAITTTFFIEDCGDEFFTKYFKTGRKKSETFISSYLYSLN